jgi:hypothetical protein
MLPFIVAACLCTGWDASDVALAQAGLDGSGEGIASDGSGTAVVVRRFDGSDMALGAPFLSSTVTGGDQRRPTVAVFPEGDFIVVWDAAQPDGTNFEVVGQRFDAAGAPLGAPLQINTYTTGNQRRPDIARSPTGEILIVWDSSGSQDGAGTGIFGQRLARDGERVGTEFQVNGFTTGGQDSAHATWVGDGFVVVWESDLLENDNASIFGQRFDSTARSVGPEFRVSSYPEDGQRRAGIAARSDGGFVVVWDSAAQDGEGRGVFARWFTSDGTALDDDVQVNTFTAGGQRSAVIAGDAAGRHLVVWQGAMQDGSSTGVFAQLYAADGARVGSEFQVNTFTTAAQDTPAVAALATGGFVVVWQSFGEDGESYGVYGRRYSADGSPAASPFRVTAAGAGEQTLAAVDSGVDRVVVVWQSRSYCPGDCDDSRAVTVDELVRGVNLALGRRVDQCPAVDPDGDQVVRVNELVRAVNATLAGCPA